MENICELWTSQFIGILQYLEGSRIFLTVSLRRTKKKIGVNEHVRAILNIKWQLLSLLQNVALVLQLASFVPKDPGKTTLNPGTHHNCHEYSMNHQNSLKIISIYVTSLGTWNCMEWSAYTYSFSFISILWHVSSKTVQNSSGPKNLTFHHSALRLPNTAGCLIEIVLAKLIVVLAEYLIPFAKTEKKPSDT